MPEIVSIHKIWDRAPHCAFTDLLRFRGEWLCAFREGAAHAGCRGRIRVISSRDGGDWKSAALIAERGFDLRDPKLGRGRGGRLELLMGGSSLTKGEYRGRRPRLAFSRDGRKWTRPLPILAQGDWLWRTTRLGRMSYGITYRLPGPRRWTVSLLESGNGLDYHEILDLGIPGLPNEATIRFRADGSALALLRREAGRAWIGASRAPYDSWSWSETAHRVGGPNFLILPDGEAWAAARLARRGRAFTAIARMTARSLDPVLELPSGGDCGYPGMVYHRGLLWVSYYSSHEGRASIYLAKVRP